MLSISRIARLKVYSLSKSCCRATASNARRLASADRRLAMSAVVRKLNRATQFCGSAMVNLPTGGKKEEIEGECGGDRGDGGLEESPETCDDQHQQQVREAGASWH